MQQSILKDKSEESGIIKLADSPPKLTREELKLLWEAIQAGQNTCYLCLQCGRPCGKTFSSEHSCELMVKPKSFSD